MEDLNPCVHSLRALSCADGAAGTCEANKVRCRTHVRVRFADTDAAGIVNYAQYLTFFEVGRSEALRQSGLSEPGIVEFSINAPVQDAVIHYRSPARFDDILEIDVWTTQVTETSCRFAYDVLRGHEATVIATGETLHVWRAATTTGAHPFRKALEGLLISPE